MNEPAGALATVVNCDLSAPFDLSGPDSYCVNVCYVSLPLLGEYYRSGAYSVWS